MRVKAVVLALSLLASAASAQDKIQGWSVTFRADSFDGTVWPYAVVKETGERIGGDDLGFVCTDQGAVVAIYQRYLSMFADDENIEFKSSSGTVKYRFGKTKLPQVGTMPALSEGDTQRLLGAMSDLDGAPMPYRTDSDQGAFPTVAARVAFDIVSSHCPKR